MKLFYYDVETTGLKHWRHGIHQISAIIEIDGEVKERVNLKVKPFERAEVDPEALAIGGVTIATLDTYMSMKDGYAGMISALSRYVDKFNKHDKFFKVGYNNAGFDDAFLRAFFVQSGDNYFGSWFWSDALDVRVLAADHFKGQRHLMENFQLRTVARACGFEVDEAKLHDAMYDIELTRNIYCFLQSEKS